jgi:hypothetical protein
MRSRTDRNGEWNSLLISAVIEENETARHRSRPIRNLSSKLEDGAERYPLTEGDWIKKLSFAKPAGEVEIAAGTMCE